MLDVGTGEGVAQVTSGDWDAGEPAWAPDGKQAHLPGDDGTRPGPSSFRAPLYSVPADGKADPQVVAFADSAVLAACWTPDGAGLLAVAMDAEKGPSAHAHLMLVPLGDDEPVELAASLDRNVMPGGPGYPGALPQVAGNGLDVVFCVRDRGCTHLYSVPLDGGEPRPLVAEPGTRREQVSVVRLARAAVVMSSPASYGEVAVVDLVAGAVATRTAYGPDPEEIELFLREEREFTISDGTVVQGWLVRDPEASGPQPLLLDIHGGPHNAWNGAADSIHLYATEG